MDISRKKFLQIVASGGMYAFLGGGLPLAFWRKGGMPLTTVCRQTLVMGSVASFTVVASSKKDGYEAIRKGIAVFHKMDRCFSMYRDDSEMARLARQSGRQPVRLSPDALTLLRRAKQMSAATGGYFDPTIEPLMRRWGFRGDKEATITPPTDRELKRMKHLIGADKLLIEQNAAMLANRGMALDTGGIAGGYTLDKAIAVMKKCDIAAAFINFSGDIHCFGEPEKGQGWPVRIFNPHTEALLSKKINLRNEALSTSGAYQNRRMAGDNHSWGHLFRPASEHPVEPVASMTAIHASAWLADAWSTAAYVGAKPPAEVQTVVIR